MNGAERSRVHVHDVMKFGDEALAQLVRFCYQVEVRLRATHGDIFGFVQSHIFQAALQRLEAPAAYASGKIDDAAADMLVDVQFVKIGFVISRDIRPENEDSVGGYHVASVFVIAKSNQEPPRDTVIPPQT